jgi:c(7)-type cytochrome triheme protein
MNTTRIAVLMAFAAVILFPGSGQTKIGGGDVEYKPKGAGPVLFRHELHVNLAGQKCTNCHYLPFQMSTNSYKLNMETLTKGKFCGSCHNGKKGFDLTTKENCKKCHQE